jgi:hypothetical protein
LTSADPLSLSELPALITWISRNVRASVPKWMRSPLTIPYDRQHPAGYDLPLIGGIPGAARGRPAQKWTCDSLAYFGALTATAGTTEAAEAVAGAETA